MLETAFWTILAVLSLPGLVLGLQFGTAMIDLSGRSLYRAAIAVAIIVVLITGICVLTLLLAGLGMVKPLAWYVPILFALILAAGASLLALRLVYRWPLREAVKGLLVLASTTIAVGAMALIPALFVMRAYKIPTNGMAPTLRGRHLEGICEHCGGPTVVSFYEREIDRSIEPAETGICGQCLRVGRAADLDRRQRGGDRVVVNRLASPRRWDVIAFRVPFGQRQIYAKRLVGLPGETIQVRDGAIWIDGEKLTPPDDIADLAWFEFEDGHPRGEYAVDRPLRLGDGECFVLGDHSPNSYDSRYWGPARTDDVIGTVDYVYWPPGRWRTLPRH